MVYVLVGSDGTRAATVDVYHTSTLIGMRYAELNHTGAL